MALISFFNSRRRSQIETEILKVDNHLIKLQKSSEKSSLSLNSESSYIESLNNEIRLKNEKINLTYFYIEACNEEISELRQVQKELSAEISQLDDSLAQSETLFSDEEMVKKESLALVESLKETIISKKNQVETIKSEILEKELKIQNGDEEIIYLNSSIKEIENTIYEHEFTLKQITLTAEQALCKVQKMAEMLAEKNKDIENIQLRIRSENEKYKNCSDEIIRLNKEEQDLQRKHLQLGEELTRIEFKKKHLEKDLEDSRHMHAIAESGINNIQNSVNDKIEFIQKYNLEISSKDKEIAEYREKIHLLTIEEQNLRKQESAIIVATEKVNNLLYEAKNNISEYQDRVSELEVEIIELSAEHRYKEQELQRADQEKTLANRTLDLRNQEFEDLQTELKKISNSINETTKETENKKTSLLKIENSISSLKEQLQNQTSQLIEYTKRKELSSIELEESQFNYKKLTEETSSIYQQWMEEKSNSEDLNRKLSKVTLDCNSLSAKLDNLKEDRSNLAIELSKSENDFNQKNEKYSNLNTDIERLQLEIVRLTDLCSSFGHKKSIIENNLAIINQEFIKNENIRKTLDVKSSELAKENSQLQTQLDEKIVECQKIASKIDESNLKISDLTLNIENKSDELEVVSGKFAKLSSDLVKLESEKQVLTIKHKENTEILELKKSDFIALSNSYARADSDHNKISLDIRESEIEIKKLSSDNDKLKNKIQSLIVEEEKLKLKFNQLENEKSFYQNEVREKSIENEVLAKNVASKKDYVDSLELAVQNIVKNLDEKRLLIADSEAILLELQNNYSTLASEQSEIKIRHARLTIELDRLNEKNDSQNTLNEKLSNEISSSQISLSELNERFIRKEAEIEILQSKIIDKNEQLREVKADISTKEKEEALLVSKLKKLYAENSNLSVLIEKDRIEVKEKSNLIEETVQSIDRMQAENEKFTVEINKLKVTIENLEKDIKDTNNQSPVVESTKFELVSSIEILERKKVLLQNSLRSAKVRSAEFDNLSSAYDRESSALNTDVKKLENDLIFLESNLSEKERVNGDKLKDLKDIRKKSAVLESDINTKRIQLSEYSRNSSSLITETNRLRKKLAEFAAIDRGLTIDNEKLSSQIDRFQDEIGNLNSKIISLSEIVNGKKEINKELKSNLENLNIEKKKLGDKPRELLDQVRLPVNEKSQSLRLARSLASKLEEQLASLSFNTDLAVLQLTESDSSRDFISALYTNMSKILGYFDSVEHVVLDCGANLGRVTFKGHLKLNSIKANEVANLFRYMNSAEINGVRLEFNSLIISYKNPFIEVQTSK